MAIDKNVQRKLNLEKAQTSLYIRLLLQFIMMYAVWMVTKQPVWPVLP